MEYDQFLKLVEEIKRKYPIWFALNSEPKSTNEDIIEIEKKLNIKLPNEYVKFIKKFGGGYFAFANVYSGNKESEWYIVEKNKRIQFININDFIAFSDNGVGDYYGFKVNNKNCQSNITFYDHEDDRLKSTEYEDVFSYIAEVGLKYSRH